MSARVVLVTGAASGIGAATVRRLVLAGDFVAAVDQLPVPAQPEPYDGQVLRLIVEVRDRSALGAAVGATLDRWGRLDAAVAAAAIVAGGRPLWETPEADLDLLWDVDVKGVWNAAAVTVPAMLTGPGPTGAQFVAIASAAAHHGLFRLAAYNAAKHAVIGLVKGLAADLVGTGAAACAVSPGSTRTRMLDATAALYDLPDVESFASNQLLRRILDPDEVAAAVAFCCSREAAVLNGSVVHADGGFAP